MSEIQTWSTTAANNNSAAPNGWPEGMAASSLNNAGREVMAAMAKWYKDTNGTLVSGGSSNAYTLTPNRTVSAYEGGLSFAFEANHTSSSTTPTLNVSSLGAKTITDQEGTALTVGDIVSGGIYQVTYDAGEGKFKLISSFVTSSGLVPFAYARVASDGTLQTGSLNISSVSKTGNGAYTLTLSSGVTNIAKCLTLASPMETGGYEISINWSTSTSCAITTSIGGGGWNADFSFLVYDTN
jgi:hypothetical protein